MSERVTLTWPELQQAALAGVQRRLRALSRGRRSESGHGTPPLDLWGNDVCAAASEMAVAKLLGVYWADSSEPDYDGDVGGYFVRSTTRANGGLLLHRQDPDERVFVLVRGDPPSFEIVGWLLARDGKHSHYWRSDFARPCYCVPAGDLHELDDLRLAP